MDPLVKCPQAILSMVSLSSSALPSTLFHPVSNEQGYFPTESFSFTLKNDLWDETTGFYLERRKCKLKGVGGEGTEKKELAGLAFE